jgi:hypothetical protein
MPLRASAALAHATNELTNERVGEKNDHIKIAISKTIVTEATVAVACMMPMSCSSLSAAPAFCTFLCTSRDANTTTVTFLTNAAQSNSKASGGARQSQRFSHAASHVRRNAANFRARQTHGDGYGRDEEAIGCFREL